MATFLLIHGSWLGAWCWEKVIPIIKENSHEAISIDLPGHGEDRNSILDVNLETYVEKVEEILSFIQDPVILVGHSMAGAIIAQVAERNPERIEHLIFIAAFLPQSGESVFSIGQQNPSSEAVKQFTVDPIANALSTSTEAMKTFAFNMTDENVFNAIKERFCPDPLMPLITPVIVSDQHLGKLAKTYIVCLNDNALDTKLQKQMCDAYHCRKIELNADHSPFYSNPEALVEAFLQVCKSNAQVSE